MGNAHHSGHGILLNVDRPLVPDLQPEEEVVVELNINGHLIVIEEWPSQSIAVPPPVGGVLRIRVYATNQDEDVEDREIGHCLVPHEICQIFHEPCFQVFLGLLDYSTMPSEDVDPPDYISNEVFQSSMIAAKTPGTPKMNLLFATCEEGLEWETEDMRHFVRQSQDKPLMKLLSHSANIITENFVSETRAMTELMCCHREFAAKEKSYQEVMKTAMREKYEMQERTRTLRALASELIFFNLMARSADFGFRLWKHHVHDMQKQRLRHLQQVGLQDMLEPDLHFRLEYAFRCWVVLHKNIHFPVKGMDLTKLGEPTREAWATNGEGFKTVNVVHGAHVGILHEHKTMKELMRLELAATQQQHTAQMRQSVHRQASFRESIRLSVDRLVLGEISGEAKSVIFHWHLAVLMAKKYRKRMKQVEQWLGHLLDGEKRLLMAHCWFCWFKCFNGSKERRMAEEETQRIQDLMSGKLGQVHEDAAMRMAEAQRKHDAAKKSTDLVLRKWEAGAAQGLLSAVFTDWHKFTMKHVAYCRQHAAVEASLRKFLEGGAKAAVHTTFLYWHKHSAKMKANRMGKATTHTALLKFLKGEEMGNMRDCFQQWGARMNYARIHAWYDAKRHDQTKEMHSLISDEKRKYEDMLDKEKTDKHAAFAYALQSWATSDNEAAVWQTFRAWHQHSQHAATHGRARQAVHSALLQIMEGKDRAAVQLCFVNWAADAKPCKIQREADLELEKWESFVEEQRINHEKELSRLCQRQKIAKERAHEAMWLMMKKWMAADTIGLLTSVFSDWKKEVANSAQLERVREATKASIMGVLEEEHEEMGKQLHKSRQRLVGLLANRSVGLASASAGG